VSRSVIAAEGLVTKGGKQGKENPALQYTIIPIGNSCIKSTVSPKTTLYRKVLEVSIFWNEQMQNSTQKVIVCDFIL